MALTRPGLISRASSLAARRGWDSRLCPGPPQPPQPRASSLGAALGAWSRPRLEQASRPVCGSSPGWGTEALTLGTAPAFPSCFSDVRGAWRGWRRWRGILSVGQVVLLFAVCWPRCCCSLFFEAFLDYCLPCPKTHASVFLTCHSLGHTTWSAFLRPCPSAPLGSPGLPRHCPAAPSLHGPRGSYHSPTCRALAPRGSGGLRVSSCGPAPPHMVGVRVLLPGVQGTPRSPGPGFLLGGSLLRTQVS